MEEQRIIVLFGDSLLMDAVAASLSGKQEFGVIRLYSPITDEECFKSLSPDLVVFDLDTPHSTCIVRFIRDQPSVPLIGLDVTSSKVILVSGQQHTLLTADDLVQTIRLQTSHSHFRSPSYRARGKEIKHNYMLSTLGTDVLQ